MNNIQNTCLTTPSFCNKTIAGCICVLAASAIALSIIGLTASPSGPLNVIVQLGPTCNGIVLGVSIFVFILDIVWCVVLFLKHRDTSHISMRDRQNLSNPYAVMDSSSAAPEDKQIAIEKQEELLRQKQFQSTSFFCKQSIDTIFTIFSYLTIDELVRCSLVCKYWQQLTSNDKLWNDFDLKSLFPQLEITDEKWHALLGHMQLPLKDAPSLNKRTIIEIIFTLKKFFRLEATDARATLLTIPKGLTCKAFQTHDSIIKEQYDKQIKFERTSQINDTVQRPFVLLIMHFYDHNASGTFKNFKEFEALAAKSIKRQKEFSKRLDAEIPTVLEALIWRFFHYHYLYDATQFEGGINCAEQFNEKKHYCVRGDDKYISLELNKPSREVMMVRRLV